jgi:hypothetical protein
LIWDSKTGLVSGVGNDGKRKPIPFEGNSCGAIPVGGANDVTISGNAELKYHYWYY